MTEVSESTTPLLKQYWELKAQSGDALLLCRMGDFYELFGPDAIEASRILEITLTTRDRNKPNPLPMAGVPWHSAQGYIQKLLDAGKKVAIAEQLEDLAQPNTSEKPSGKSIVRREIVRLLTPGIQFDQSGLATSYLGVIAPAAAGYAEAGYVGAVLDTATGDFAVGSLSDSFHELLPYQVKHLLLLGAEKKQLTTEQLATLPALTEELPPGWISFARAESLLKTQYQVTHLDALFPQPPAPSDQKHHNELSRVCGAALQYVLQSQRLENLPHIRAPRPITQPHQMVLGPRTPEHLDLDDLFEMLNSTGSAMGSRLLKQWLHSPLLLPNEISKRQEQVRCFAAAPELLREALKKRTQALYDLDRLLARLHTGLSTPKDTLALGQTLEAAIHISQHCEQLPQSECLSEFLNSLQSLKPITSELSQKILKTQKETAPISYKEGGIFNPGTHPELDRLQILSSHGQEWLTQYESAEREKTGIGSLKVRYNRVFGWYIEITNTYAKQAPAHYMRKQTMAGAERFFTDELKKFEDEYLSAESKQKTLEQELFETLIKEIKAQTPTLSLLANRLATLDALLSLSNLAVDRRWVFPTIDSSRSLTITDGRHPVVENSLGDFVPNSVSLGEETSRVLLITGPNMGGKSTVMRQVALHLILGQMGSPLPARDAHWGAVSSLYTRIGANDAIARGQSTFMVEMSELAHILRYANDRSFLVLDEIGRGTSTWDGLSVAWAALEWIATTIQARTLFATHYHELTTLSETFPQISNAHMAVATDSKKSHALRFLYELKPGATNESFGIQVAAMAGVPKAVVERAWKALKDFEALQSLDASREINTLQPSLFETALPSTAPSGEPSAVERALHEVDPNRLTPIEALCLVAKLRELTQGHPQNSESQPKLA